MTTREKIIVGVMCLTIVYGIYEVVGNKGARSKPTINNTNPAEELKKFATSVTQKLVSEKVSEEYRYLIGQAGDDWNKDPFIHSTAPLTKQAALPSSSQNRAGGLPLPQFIYTGYLQVGDTKMAVINGMEYAVGESLKTKGLYVKSIAPLKVVIGKLNGEETIQLPITESTP